MSDPAPQSVPELDPDTPRDYPCPECGEVLRGKPHGPGSGPFLLASHRYRMHKVTNPGRRPKGARGREPQTEEELAERGVVGVVRDARDQIPTGTGAPSKDNLTKAFGRGLGLASTAVASYAVETDELLTDEQRDAQCSELSLTQRQAEEIVRPLANAIAGTSLNRRYGRQVVENVDVVSSISELATLVLHWRRYFRQRAVREGRVPPPHLRGAIDANATAAPGSLPPPAGPGPGGAPIEGAPHRPPITTPAPSNGHVVSAEDLHGGPPRGAP